ncbi:MAG TPA: putative colanic acid biosynthesis acetyltransferase [Cyclobacteriaceae bacterium]|nr:putative colanic acid biosynthesis acetyltransferase [Cyclobacteriaceae bacterium]
MPKYYSTKEIILRAIWAVVEPVFFRLSPRLFYSWRNMILRLMGAKLGKNVRVFPTTKITFPWLLTTGDNVVISWNVRVYNLGTITIGSGTVVSQHAHLCGGTHDHRSPDFTLLRTGLTIGSKCWIAADAFVGPGVVIGDRAIVGARAVVVHNVEPRTIVAGNPAKVVGNISDN